VRACSLGPAGKVSFLFAAALTVLGATGASTGVGEQQSGCEPYDSTWIGELSEYQALASDTDSITAVGRTLFHLPQLPKDSVSLVSDSATCMRAVLAYGRNLDVPDTITPRRVILVRFGPTRYVVGDPHATVGEFTIDMVFDSSFTTVLATFAK